MDLTNSLENLTSSLRNYQSYRLVRESIRQNSLGLEIAEKTFVEEQRPTPMLTPATSSLLLHLGVPVNHRDTDQDIEGRLRAKAEKSRQLIVRSNESNEQIMKAAMTARRAALEPLNDSMDSTAETEALIGLQDLDGRLSKLKSQIELLHLEESSREAASREKFLRVWK